MLALLTACTFIILCAGAAAQTPLSALQERALPRYCNRGWRSPISTGCLRTFTAS